MINDLEPIPYREIHTQRLTLRQWKEEDRAPFAELNGDGTVMEFFPKILTRQESDAMVDSCSSIIEKNGWGFWAVSCPGVADFIGMIGLHIVSFEAQFTPAVEIGWRLSAPYWGKAYAPEGAHAALNFAFDVLGLDEVVSFTAVPNKKSMRVMEKIGMSRDPDEDFDHPALSRDHPLCRHVLYRVGKEQYRSDCQSGDRLGKRL